MAFFITLCLWIWEHKSAGNSLQPVYTFSHLSSKRNYTIIYTEIKDISVDFWCQSCFSFISKFLLVQQKFFVKKRYCILQLMQSCLHPHGKRQCFLSVAVRSNSHPDYNNRTAPVHLPPRRTPVLLWIHYWQLRKRRYMSAQFITCLLYSLNYWRI